MATYRRETRVDAPLETVWNFHSTIDGLEALTPKFLHLEIDAVTGPEGRPNPASAELVTGSRIELSIRPFGVGPRQRMVSVITDRTIDEDAREFRDVMESGPFERWEHTHQFVAEGAETVLVDRVDYQLPGGSPGALLTPLGWIVLAPMFRGRHRKTKVLLERSN